MNWIKRLFGLSTPLEKKKKKLKILWHEAMVHQRNGDLREYAKIVKQAEALEDEIVEDTHE
ncbi:DUF6435 family protein [bacterium]|nr:DUF6435 family protein [bacterium]